MIVFKRSMYQIYYYISYVLHLNLEFKVIHYNHVMKN